MGVMLHRLVGLSLLLAGAFGFTGCANPEEDPRPIDGSTYRIGEPEQGEKTELYMKVFTSYDECRATFGPDVAGDCTPQVDRSTGQVRLAFQTLDKSTMMPYYLPLAPDHVQVGHNRRPIKEGGKSGSELVRHNPRRSGQLFIVLIDGSGSMYENNNEQINNVYQALLRPKVKESFFPRDAETGVVLLRFTSSVKSLAGGAPRVIERPKGYETAVRSHLYSGERGFTHLYDAVAYAVGPLIDEEGAVRDWLAIHRAEPTIIALTDGFNNEKGSDLCRDNVPRLQEVLEEIELARNKPLGLRPTVFTVGLGVPIRKGFEEVPRGRVTVRDLCARHANEMINGRLERRGIDNVSLKWMAERGGGQSFVKRNSSGLAQVFQEAAAVRYEWYQVFYKVDRFHHRQSFETRIRLTSFANAEATIRVYPSGWIDAPTPRRAAEGRWSEPARMRDTFGMAMPLFGGLIFLAFLGPATFNARRAMTRKPRGGSKKQQAPPGGAEAGVAPDQGDQPPPP
ncbi:MAG: VWA domain-containing protein [Deltaproteobacteria bacterium]|nr:VWA domain-containing protein [Deltaproteobacteria bacterium]MBW2256400.1 VWA domain-containing protein [Deltaproteobacteria bacterium]